MPKSDDLMLALGTPAKPAGKKAGSSYLDSKPAQLRMYLEDAAGGDLKRAEALCRAIEFARSETAEPDADDGMPMEDEY
jgi:hypothetical protein